jgi:hypothetical protein
MAFKLTYTDWATIEIAKDTKQKKDDKDEKDDKDDD